MIISAAGERELVDDESNNNNNNFSALVFAVVSLVIYMLFLRPTTNGNNTTHQQRQQAAQALAGGGRESVTPRARRVMGNNNNNNNNSNTRPAAVHSMAADRPVPRMRPMSDSAVEVLSTCQTKPPHMASSTNAAHDVKIGGSNVLVDGLVAFSYTQAASSSSSSSSSHTGTLSNTTEEDAAAIVAAAAAKRNQVRERAKILNQLLLLLKHQSSPSTIVLPPPPKGSTLVFGLSQEHIQSSFSNAGSVISKVLSNLATNYTVIVIVQVNVHEQQQNHDYTAAQTLHSKIVNQLRASNCSSISEAILPSHRILLASSVTGRIALVRQLATVELVVDFDTEVRTQLERFGYKVAVVPEWQTSFPWLSSKSPPPPPSSSSSS